ncbi:MAG: family 10 glycosylhydrolase [Bacteroidales bacterium]
MKRNILSLLFIALTMLGSIANPKSEIRAVWLTTNSGSDWPKSEFDIETQKSDLCAILDRLEVANFNTIVLQVQVKGDVMWDSDIQPAMYDITGNGALDIQYDVCEYAIEQCHNRGMECHAWIVPYRIGSTTEAARYNNNRVKHVTTTNPELCVLYSGNWYLDPGLPETTDYLVNLYAELISKHDFDGTNFDYTRYPGSDFDDAASYALYGDGMTLDDWRRNNINTFVAEFYEMAKEINPDIKVGAAPYGTYKNVEGYSNTTAYYSVYQDACQWMQSGNQDLLIPQMYWNETYGFSPNMTTWVDNSAGRQLVVGLAPYKMVDNSNNWEAAVITDQIEKVRAEDGMSGVCFFRTDHVISTTQSKIVELYSELVSDYFQYPANIVPMDYNGITKPNAPVNPTIKYEGTTYTIEWETPELDADNTPIKYYCVYGSTSDNVDISDISKCVGHYITDNSFTYSSRSDVMNFVITTFDKNYYESEPTIVSGVSSPEVNALSFDYANGNITVKSATTINNIEIISTAGATVIQKQIESETAQIDCNSLTNSVYIVNIRFNNDSNATYKIIRK